jgi:predicted  nucleic acid-binding Zn-ribbon protein
MAMNSEKNPNQERLERPSDIRKQVKHFQESRDEWKERNAQKRSKIQALMTDNNRLEKRLMKEKEDAQALKKQLKQAQARLEEVEEAINIKDQEIEILKKKLSKY